MFHESHFGYAVLAVAVFASSLCLPLPSEVILVAAGALIAGNGLHFPAVLAVCVCAGLCGDAVWYEAGRFWGSRIVRVLMSFSDDPREATRKGRELFERWGSITLVVAKFLPGLDSVTVPLAGVEGFPRRTFYAFDFIGSLLWSLLYLMFGYIFSSRVGSFSGWIHRFGTILTMGLFIPLFVLASWRIWTTLRMVRRLKTKRISPSLLYQRMESGEKIAIIDLINFEEAAPDTFALPGAVRLNPGQLRKNSRLTAPGDVQIVLYGSTDSVFRSARVALSLQRKGFASMWILEGGLEAWKKAGLPTSNHFETEAAGAARLGIQILKDQ